MWCTNNDLSLPIVRLCQSGHSANRRLLAGQWVPFKTQPNLSQAGNRIEYSAAATVVGHRLTISGGYPNTTVVLDMVVRWRT